VTRDRVVVALLAVLAVGALGLGATAIDAIDAEDGGSDGTGQPDQPAQRTTPTGDGGLGWLAPVGGVIVVLGLLGGAALVLDAMTPRVALICGLVLLTGLLIAVFLPHVSPPDGSANATTPTPGATSETTPSTPTPGSADSGDPTSPSAVLALFVAVAVLGGFGIYHFTRSHRPHEDVDSCRGDEAAALGRAAGRAADRIDATDLENGVYRAWHEMTDVLDVDTPETTTPAEFADAAVAAGLDEDDVATLTDLFREVRYGDADLTDEREREARAALRRIEASYAVDGADLGPDDGGRPG